MQPGLVKKGFHAGLPIANFPTANSLSPILTLLRKDLLTEWRQKHALFGVLLYVGSTVFAVYTMAGQPEAAVWNALFWITQLFVAVNSVARSFLGESTARYRYYFTLVKPAHFFIAKLVYSLLLQMLVGLVSLGLFATLLGMPVTQAGRFLVAALLGSASLSVVFAFLSAIASRAGGNAALMAILGFPLLTPVLMMLSKLALGALTPVYVPGWWSLAGALGGFDGLVVVLGLVLFPFLWKE